MALAASRNMLSVDNAWNAVALEERLELLSRAHAHGILAGLGSFALLGSIAYGFDQIYLLGGGALIAFFVVPMFMSYSWRRGKPAMILAYLAARTVARRYAFGYKMLDLDVVLIYRGTMREVYKDRESEEMVRQRQEVGFNVEVDGEKEVWITLLRGSVVIMSERDGGAKLEFITAINNDTVVRKARPDEGGTESSLVVEGVTISKGRVIMLNSKALGAQYVFEKQLGRLIVEYKPPVPFQVKSADDD